MRAAWDALYRRGPAWHGPAPPPFFGSQLPADALVLEVGCGDGKTLRALRRAGPSWRLVGVDFSRPALARVRGAPVAVGDAAALPLRSAACDAVVVRHLLGHLTGPVRGAVAREVERVLRPGGFLEVREFAVGDLRDGVGEGVEGAWMRGGVATYYLAPGELAALFAGCAGEERVEERAVRFSARPRRVAQLRARKRREEELTS